MIKSKKRLAFLAVALLVVGVLWLAKTRIQRYALQWIVLHQDTPGEFAMRDVVEGSPDHAVALQQLWATGRIVPREFVVSYMRDKSIFTAFTSMWPDLKSVTMEAVSSGDMDTQQAALGLLEGMNDPSAVPIALAMLNDVDPQVRYLALTSLSHAKDRRFIPVFVRMLHDRDPMVRGYAMGCLQMVTDQSFGFEFDGDTATRDANVEKWKAWWEENKQRYVDFQLPTAADLTALPLGPAPDFSLPDVQGNNVRLSELKGKPVLIVFWASWLSPCVKQVPILKEFHEKRGNDAVILAVAVDELKDSETGKQHFGLEGAMSDRLKKFVAEHEVPYRILMDADGRALGPYSGGDIPVAVWIDRNGTVRRRFMGVRSAQVLSEMLDSLDSPAGNVAMTEPRKAG